MLVLATKDHYVISPAVWQNLTPVTNSNDYGSETYLYTVFQAPYKFLTMSQRTFQITLQLFIEQLDVNQ